MDDPAAPPTPIPPPRAFTQGAGTIFQLVGGLLFLASSTLCCTSGLLSKEFAERPDWTTFGWHLPGDAPEKPSYSAQRSLSISLFAAVGLGLATAGAGLGMQATRRHSATGALVIATFGALFWAVQTLFFAEHLPTFALLALTATLTLIFVILAGLAFAAVRELRRDPPPPGHEILPKEYKVPYSHYHDDPPDVRLAHEIEQRRQRLEVQRRELETLEDKARRAKEEREDAP